MTKEEVRAARDELGLTQKEFAKELGVSFRTVEKWEQGERTPRGAAVTAIQLVLEKHRGKRKR